MGSHNLLSSTAEENKAKKRAGNNTKPSNRAFKRTGGASAHHNDIVNLVAGLDSHHTRVWKACERCRMKKTKCDGEFPCKRCKDDGLVCTASARKRMEYKQLPKGYAEVLENTQLTLVATIHKLYSMVRNGQSWELGEPNLNDCGQPVVHDIAQKLGCIRPHSDIDLPPHSVFPADESTMAELARQLEEQQPHDHESSTKAATSTVGAADLDSRADRASFSDLQLSDLELDYRKITFGNHTLSLSSQRPVSGSDFEFSMAPVNLGTGALVSTPTTMPDFSSSWTIVPNAQQQQHMTLFISRLSGGNSLTSC